MISSSHTDAQKKSSSRRQAAATPCTNDRRRHPHKAKDDDETVVSAPAEIQIAYEPEDGSPRKSRSIARSAKSTLTEQQQSQDDDDGADNAKNVSFQDQLAEAALNGTIEFLKVAGGLTLNATGKVVAPPLHVTRTVLLPAFWAATVDYLGSRTPKRVKDWLRILSSSVYHVVDVIKETKKGQIFRQRLLLLGGDLLDILSADSTRQVLIDAMAGFVKFNEALHTPEFKAFLDQFTVLCCRLTQVAASGRTQQAMHDTKSLVWSGVELIADPRSTTALAEVTAYLCHALEMEDAILNGAMSSSTNQPQQKSSRRKERDQYQKETFQQKTTLMTNPDATVEQVILSSLGGGGGGTESMPGCDESDGFSSHDVQSDVMNSMMSEGGGRVFTSDAGSIRKQVEEASLQNDEEWHEQAQKNVNVAYLQDQISKRAERHASRNQDIPRDIPIVTTVTNEGLSANNPPTDLNQTQLQTKLNIDEISPDGQEGEDAMDRFYRVLDAVLKDKRVEGLDHLLAQYTDSAQKVFQDGKVRKFDQREKDDKPHDVVLADTIRSRLAQVRADVSKGLDRDDREKLKRMEVMIKQNSWIVYFGIALVVGFVLLWVAFGCYGIYTFFSPTVRTVQAHLTNKVFPGQHAYHHRPSAENEIVIRLVREIVHTDSQGTIFDQSPDPTHLSQERVEKIAACMSESLE